jgi:hypothetical protein
MFSFPAPLSSPRSYTKSTPYPMFPESASTLCSHANLFIWGAMFYPAQSAGIYGSSRPHSLLTYSTKFAGNYASIWEFSLRADPHWMDERFILCQGSRSTRATRCIRWYSGRTHLTHCTPRIAKCPQPVSGNGLPQSGPSRPVQMGRKPTLAACHSPGLRATFVCCGGSGINPTIAIALS